MLVLKLLLDLFKIKSFTDLGHLLQNEDINNGSKDFQYLLILDHLKLNYLWVFELGMWKASTLFQQTPIQQGVKNEKNESLRIRSQTQL